MSTKDDGGPTVVFLYESIAKSWLSDLGTLLVFVAMIGLGWGLESSAMQWVGGLLFFVWCIVRGRGRKSDNRKTPQEAADWLAEKFNVTAEDKERG